jgi:hypothetical protein
VCNVTDGLQRETMASLECRFLFQGSSLDSSSPSDNDTYMEDTVSFSSFRSQTTENAVSHLEGTFDISRDIHQG